MKTVKYYYSLISHVYITIVNCKIYTAKMLVLSCLLSQMINQEAFSRGVINIVMKRTLTTDVRILMQFIKGQVVQVKVENRSKTTA